VILQFAEFELDSEARQLLKGGVPLHLSRKAFDAFCLLVERRPGTVSKDELHARLWPGTFVVDANLSVTIAEIRKVLADDPQSPRFIRTVHRVGYAFCAEAHERHARAAASGAWRAWLFAGDRILRLEDGENLIGRDPACGVWLDEAGVSRRHARVMLQRDVATVEDLGSKNGTAINGTPVTAITPLTDGDRLQIGPVTLGFRTQAGSAATRTVRLRRK
jgi:DNA-binding winged helix-turn-helix (wHTH) protein